MINVPRAKPVWKSTCRCVCGCGRRSVYSMCSYCSAGAHKLPSFYQGYTDAKNAARADRARTECTRCFVHHQWYELQPGTGLCNSCSS